MITPASAGAPAPLASPLMPALFMGHGSPTNTLELNDYTRQWRAIGKALPRPRAIVAISAHWYFGATAVTAMPRPRTIHDFYGFSRELNEYQYPAPGAPDIAAEIVEAVRPEWVGLDNDQWGLDHGTWSVLAHMFPDADVPVLQLSLNALRPLEYHVALGQRLAPLRAKGVMFIASGNIVHNLRMMDRMNLDGAYDWAYRFDEAAARQLADSPGDLLRLRDHADYDLAVPTPDHFLPLLYLGGLAAVEGAVPTPLVTGCALGSISMSSYGLGVDIPALSLGSAAGTVPANIPPDQTNS